ncbi:undecaprenyl-diphosphate phosphatase [Pelotomaculum isophthalicicum JI]|uniref:Undecaprenyl-diphosphatase n=1 Tax=Pelotomaculum isophthalicicum JI TaxID=947010 RepID=A0A9X4H0Y0_9FIRM|nr:undecaprenyl-diphosphate phosphatase [Pelotomaculum isophthalicicum]MDF9407656.1 undecaprenyl-diphosphate phosphatase [Pelotomaculum isophthalicicum JI]
MDSFFSAIILGIVEGITEFLPISSTGHLILVNKLVGFTGNFANMFDVVIQLGAILSVVVYFWSRIFPFGSNKTIIEKKEVWGLWQKTVIGVVPALLIGGTLGKRVEELLFNPLTVALALVIGGIVLIVIERRNRNRGLYEIHSEEKFYTVRVLPDNYRCCRAILERDEIVGII